MIPKIKSLMILALTCLSLNLYSYTFTWSGATSTAWNTSSNWTRTGTGSGNTTPGSADAVVISNGSATNQPVLNANLTITDFTVSAGSLDLNGFTLTVNNDAHLTGGAVKNGSLSAIDYQDMQHVTFTGPLTITKLNGGGSNDVDGGNIFNGSITIINKDNSRLRLANSDPDDFNGNVVFQQISSGSLDPAYNDDNTFAGNISTVGTSTAIRFGRGNGVVVINGSSAQSILADVATEPTFDEIEVNSTGTLNLSNALTINENMAFTKGIVNTSSTNLLIFDKNATVSGASNISYVDGPVRRLGNSNNFDFPTGDSGSYAPISISSLSGGVATNYFTAQYFKSVNSNAALTLGTGLNHVSTNEYWILDRSGSVQAYVTLSYNSSDRSGPITDATVLRIAHWNGTNWGDEGRWTSSSTSATSGTIRTTNRLASFSPFTLGSASILNGLPLKLLDINGQALASGQVLLNWRTVSEEPGNYFAVESSTDGYNWALLGRVEGYGNSESVRNYSYADRNHGNALVYYRLKMFTSDGAYTYSPIVSVKLLSAETSMAIYPNPSSGIVNIEMGGTAGTASVELFDQAGKRLNFWEKQFSGAFSIDMSSFAAGVYTLSITVDGMTTRTKLVKR